MLSPEQDAEVTRLLREFDRVTGRLFKLGVNPYERCTCVWSEPHKPECPLGAGFMTDYDRRRRARCGRRDNHETSWLPGHAARPGPVPLVPGRAVLGAGHRALPGVPEEAARAAQVRLQPQCASAEPPVKAERRCWWCGQTAEVDTELPESGGLVRDSDTSWLCADNQACCQRAYTGMLESGYQRNKGRP